METILNILEQMNIPQLIAILAFLWFFYNRLDKKMEKSINALEKRLNERIDAIEKRMDALEKRLNERIDAIEKRLILVEDKLTSRIDNLYGLFTGFFCAKKDIDRRLDDNAA